MQELWTIRLDWGEELPSTLRSRWIEFRNQFNKVSTVTLPRWLGTGASVLALELHGFSDASQHALAAVVYLRVCDSLNTRVTLINSKTKVAPLKRVTIPRLKLSAAVILVRLIRQVRDVLELSQTTIHLWTDSTFTFFLDPESSFAMEGFCKKSCIFYTRTR